MAIDNFGTRLEVPAWRLISTFRDKTMDSPSASASEERPTYVVLSLVAFGVCIGLLTGLSEGPGTVVALIGLLFAAIGGTFTSLYQKNGPKPKERTQIILCAGLVSGGLMGGVIFGVGAKIVQYVYLPVRAVPANAFNSQTATSGPASREDKKPENQKKTAEVSESRVFQPPGVLHAALMDDIDALRSKVTEAVDAKKITEGQGKAIFELMNQMETVEEVREVMCKNATDDFTRKFDRVFPPATTQPK
jgi:hypothetical protein